MTKRLGAIVWSFRSRYKQCVLFIVRCATFPEPIFSFWTISAFLYFIPGPCSGIILISNFVTDYKYLKQKKPGSRLLKIWYQILTTIWIGHKEWGPGLIIASPKRIVLSCPWLWSTFSWLLVFLKQYFSYKLCRAS